VIAGVLVALLVPQGEGVWDGHFRLTIAVSESEPIDRESLRFAMTWNEREAQQALGEPDLYQYGLIAPEWSADGQAILDVSCCGRVKTWGTIGTYNHPRFLIAEYRLAESDEQSPTRKLFEIPDGRGDRSMAIELP